MSSGYSQSASLRSSTPNNCSAVYQDLLALLLIQASPHPQNKKRHAITYSPYITSCLIIIIIFCVFRSPEYRLHQYHIKHRTAAYTEQSAFFPFMQCHDKQNGNQFRYPIMAASRNIFQAVHHQQSDHCIRQHCPQICDHSKRVVIVPNTTTATVIICCVIVIVIFFFLLPWLRPDLYIRILLYDGDSSDPCILSFCCLA